MTSKNDKIGEARVAHVLEILATMGYANETPGRKAVYRHGRLSWHQVDFFGVWDIASVRTIADDDFPAVIWSQVTDRKHANARRITIQARGTHVDSSDVSFWLWALDPRNGTYDVAEWHGEGFWYPVYRDVEILTLEGGEKGVARATIPPHPR